MEKGGIKVLKSSLNKKVWITYLYDLVFYAVLVICFLGFVSVLGGVLKNLGDLDYSKIMSTNIADVQPNLAILEAVFVRMILIILALLFVMLLAFSFFKGLIWNKLLDKKISWKYYLKSLVFNFIWGGLFLAAVIYFAAVLENQMAVFVSLIVFWHFSAMNYYLFTKTGKFSILKTVIFTFAGIKRYILSYLLIAISFIIASYILGWVSAATHVIVYLALLVLLFSFYRSYFVKSMENAEN